MTYYHKSKEAALAAAAPFEEYWRVRASFEPNNGWVIVLQPKTIEVFKWPLDPLLEVAEIDLTNCPRLYRYPAERKRTAPVMDRARAQRQPGAAPAPRPKMEVIELTGENRIKPAWER